MCSLRKVITMVFKCVAPVVISIAIIGTLAGCASSTNTQKQPEVTSWIKLSEFEWRTNLTISGKEWNLHAIHKEGILYFRRWAECPDDSEVSTEEIVTQAKLVMSYAARTCTGEFGFAFSGGFLSNQFLNTLPDQVRAWYDNSPQPPVVNIQVPIQQTPGEQI
jgi:hypothetical protein